jgi:hypothetical protein
VTWQTWTPVNAVQAMLQVAAAELNGPSRERQAGREPGVRHLLRRLQNLEGRLTDATRLVPHSDAWFAYYEDQLARWEVGEEFPCIPLAVIDRIVEEADREEALSR